MNIPDAPAAARPFFCTTPFGKRLYVYYPPAARTSFQGSVLYVPPFAEEMNMARHLAAQQARALSTQGFGVLHVDLFGCGDSEGELSQVTWELWIQDLVQATSWLNGQHNERVVLLAPRLGALLAMCLARELPEAFRSVLFWQPVLDGKAYLTQFLRLQVTADTFAGRARRQDVQGLRTLLADGQTLEIAGYDINPSLAHSLDALDGTAIRLDHVPIHWFELSPGKGLPISPQRRAQQERLSQAGNIVHLKHIDSPCFWSATELLPAPDLLNATTCTLMEEVRDIH